MSGFVSALTFSFKQVITVCDEAGGEEAEGEGGCRGGGGEGEGVDLRAISNSAWQMRDLRTFGLYENSRKNNVITRSKYSGLLPFRHLI